MSHPRSMLNLMSSPILPKLARLLLAVSVSLWMAGAGCLLGCSNSVQASQQKAQTESCHARTHDCCKKKVSQTSTDIASLIGETPEGMIKDCPLAVNASAAISKATDGGINSTALTAHTVDDSKPQPVPASHIFAPVQFLNRGPTYLRCCVFLI
jgi:hypothetical protein